MLTDPEEIEQTLELDWLCPALPVAAVSFSVASVEFEESSSAGLLRAPPEVADAGASSSAGNGPKDARKPLRRRDFGGKADSPAACVDHALTHFPKLSTCDICSQVIPKMQNYRRR